QFEKALYEGELYGSSSSAKELLQGYKTNLEQKELGIMNDLLLDAILNRAQRNINLFVSGRAMVGQNENLELIVSDFGVATKMLGEKHFMYQELVDKKAFFQAMIILQNGETKKYDEAEERILNLQSKYPNAAYLNQGLGMLYIKKSNKQKAEEQLAQASKKVSTWTKPMNSSAYLSIIEGKLDVASQKIAASEKLGENKDNTYLLKAHLHSAGYELQNAEKALINIKNEDGNISLAELLAIEGRINELRGRISVAQSMYQKSLNADKDNVDLLMRMGNLYKNERDTTTALSFFKKVLKLKPNNQSAQANIALLQNKPVNINSSFINASDVKEVLLAVNVLEDKKEFAKAITLLQRSINVVNWNPDLYYELGKMQYSNGQEVESMTSIKKAIEISPYHFKSIRSLAYMYLGEKKNREADALIKKHDAYFKKSAKYLALSYQVYRQIDSKRDLYPLLERAIELDSLETDAYKALYQLHIEDNRFGEALREFNNLINIGGGSTIDSIDFYNRVEKQVKYRIELHAYEELKEGLKIILDQDLYNFEMFYFMGLVLYIEGDYTNASKYLRKFNKDIQAFSPGVQRTYYQLKAKINLETGHPDLAYRLFGMSASRIEAPNYLGLAMAQYELGKSWIDNFRRAKEPIDFNEDGIKRYEKMKKKAAKMGGSYGGAERNRR
ncbi:MAG TPA: hypothetical protein EYG86_01210, partial [Crocinitomicaceae bacterium]|nr:hypothetical protein [Crocinitomicaceae bacterium]